MSSRLRSASLGAAPRPKKHFTSRAESAAAAALDVRCACQFFQSSSLLPERINPVGSRPSSSLDYYSRPSSRNEFLFTSHSEDIPDDHGMETDFSFGIVQTTDYYAESVSRPNSPVSSVDHTELLDLKMMEAQYDDKEPSPVVAQRESTPIKQRDPSTSRVLYRRSSQQSLGMSSAEEIRGAGHRSLIDQKRSLQTKSLNQAQQGTAVPETPTKQRDPSTSRVLKRRLSSQSKSFDEIKGQPPPPPPPPPGTGSNVIKQRDPSTSSLLRKRLNSQSKPISDNSNQQGKENQPNVLKQRDPSTSSLLRKRMSMQSRSFDETTRTDAIKQRDPSASSLLKKRFGSQQQPLTSDLLKDYARPSAEPDPENMEVETNKPPGRSIFSMFKREPKDEPMEFEDDISREMEMETHPKESGRSLFSMFRKEPKDTDLSLIETEVTKAATPVNQPTIKEALRPAQNLNIGVLQINVVPPTPAIETVDKSLPNVTASIPARPAETQPKKPPEMVPKIVDKPHPDIIVPLPPKPVQTQQHFAPENKEPEITKSSAVDEANVKSSDTIENQANKENQEHPKNEEHEVENKNEGLKTIAAGLFKSVPMSLIGDIIHASKRSPSKDEEDLPLDMDTRLFDHYNIETKHIEPHPIPIPSPPKLVAATIPSPIQNEPSTDILPKKPELIRRSDIISGFQDQGIISTPSPPTVIKQKDPTQSTLLRKRYSQSLDRKQEMGSQNSLRSNSAIRQKDPTTSTLLKRRHMSRAVSHDRAATIDTLPDRIGKNVSFEFDKQLLSGPYDEDAKNTEFNKPDVGEITIKTEDFELDKVPDIVEQSQIIR